MMTSRKTDTDEMSTVLCAGAWPIYRILTVGSHVRSLAGEGVCSDLHKWPAAFPLPDVASSLAEGFWAAEAIQEVILCLIK